MNILFLMANVAKGKDGYPLYLTELSPKTLLEKQIDLARKLNPKKMIFCIQNDEVKKFNLDYVIKCLEKDAEIIKIKGKTSGAVCTAMLAIEHIDNDEELLIAAIDDFIDQDNSEIINYFRNQKADAGVVSFTSIHPLYSYVATNEHNEAIEFAEKKPISKNALVSFYYYKKGSDFIECSKAVIAKDNPIRDNFFISQTLNEMLLRVKNIAIYKIANDIFFPLKTTMQIGEYLAEYRSKKEM